MSLKQEPEIIDGVVDGLSILVTQDQLVTYWIGFFLLFFLFPIIFKVLPFIHRPMHPLKELFNLTPDRQPLQHRHGNQAKRP